MSQIYFGLGTNLGNREENLRSALPKLEKIAIVESVSSVYETMPVGVLDQPLFLNMVAKASTNLTPQETLQCVKLIEQDFGRVPSERYGPRLIDIDILLYDDLIMNTFDLVIPHPRLHQRAFVMVPLMDISPDFNHPVMHKSIAMILQSLGDVSRDVRRMDVIL